MAVNTEWKKTGINIEYDLGNGQKRRRNFNGVNQQATSEQIKQFAEIIGKLTGESVVGIKVIKTEEIAPVIGG